MNQVTRPVVPAPGDPHLLKAAPQLFEALRDLVAYTPFPLHNQHQVAAFHLAIGALVAANAGNPLSQYAEEAHP